VQSKTYKAQGALTDAVPPQQHGKVANFRVTSRNVLAICYEEVNDLSGVSRCRFCL